MFERRRAGLTRVISETRPLDHVNEAIADVEAGRVAARTAPTTEPARSSEIEVVDLRVARAVIARRIGAVESRLGRQ